MSANARAGRSVPAPARSVSRPRPTGAGGYLMPAEWEPHRATWIAWPHHAPDWPGRFGPIPWCFGEIVRALTRGEVVSILVDDRPRSYELAACSGGWRSISAESSSIESPRTAAGFATADRSSYVGRRRPWRDALALQWLGQVRQPPSRCQGERGDRASGWHLRNPHRDRRSTRGFGRGRDRCRWGRHPAGDRGVPAIGSAGAQSWAHSRRARERARPGARYSAGRLARSRHCGRRHARPHRRRLSIRGSRRRRPLRRDRSPGLQLPAPGRES